ncbi:hypothetical protein JCM2421_05730 [Staphylococcus auricularis]|nr:hypothetical protein JCM2421_05730 [Staphylococcus auricularis]
MVRNFIIDICCLIVSFLLAWLLYGSEFIFVTAFGMFGVYKLIDSFVYNVIRGE